jgi:hypothetical protein|tara:strand:- start:252 stop:542 length:291 start_codon:yes stop_codon:yes gene_type:complete
MSSWSFGQRVIKNQTRTVNTGSQVSDAFTDGVVYVRCTSDTTGVFIAFAKSPTAAVATGIRLVANEPKTFKIDNAEKLAAIIASGTASVFIEELSE